MSTASGGTRSGMMARRAGSLKTKARPKAAVRGMTAAMEENPGRRHNPRPRVPGTMDA